MSYQKNGKLYIKVGDKEFKITKKQEFFCRIYVSNGHNGTKAAREAKYSLPEVQSSENLRKPYLIRFIEELEQPVFEKLKVDENWVLSKLKNFADTTVLDFFEVIIEKKINKQTKKERTEIHLQLKDLTKLPPEKIASIEYIEETKPGVFKVKLVDKKASIVDIGRHLGMFKEQLEGNFNVSGSGQGKTVVYIIPGFIDDN